jgi:UDP-N-acetylmuramoyl-tripeptide--D-alanyl-D-alanine ligase
VAEGKGELIAALPADGTAVLNADDDRVAAMAPRSAAAVLTFGVVRPADVTASDITIDDDLCPSFTMRTPWGSVGVRLGVAGRHQVTNALAAASAALAMGAPLDVVAAGLAEGHLSANRMDLRRAPNGLRVLNDAYNANPTSMRAALDALARPPSHRGARHHG